MAATSFVVRDPDWNAAVEQVRQRLTDDGVSACDLALVFVSHYFADHFRDIVAAVGAAAGATTLLGCSGQGVIGGAREIENFPAIAVATIAMPGVAITARRVTQVDVQSLADVDAWSAHTGVAAGGSNGWIVLGDPFTIDPERLIAMLHETYPGTAIVGGMASGDFQQRATHLFLDGEVFHDGAVIASIGGPWQLRAVVAQGAAPIGEPWTVTAVEGQMLQSIGSRPAYEVLASTFADLPDSMRERAQRNLLVGLAMDEYRDEFVRGDFLIRNLLGADRELGVLGIGAIARVGQTLQFQVRDAAAADEDLREMLDGAERDFGDAVPAGALLCSCNGRGMGLFESPDHDALALAQRFGAMPVAGFFCNGEIGPVGGTPYVHGFTASIGFFLPKQVPPAG